MTTLGSRTAQYDVFNKPTRIGNTQFVYGPTHEKVKTISGGTTTYHYAGGSYLEESSSTSLITKAYVGGYYLRETTAGVSTEHYLHFDHLGSVEAISDADGNFVSRMSFDAFGNRRDANWTALAAPPTTNAFATDWGFTGHDMVDAEAVVHMGGRVYDPTIGRVLSADLYVQAPDHSQSYNRYSYVANNPLSRIDPTGYQSCPPGKTCEEVTATGARRRAHDEEAAARALAAMYFLRDWQSFNIDWRQMAQVSGDWTGFAVETAFSWTVQPIFEGGIETAFHIQTGDYMAAAGTGIGIGAEMTAGKIVRGAKAAKEALKGAEKVKPGEFNIFDWKGYPDGVPKPKGPVRLVEGAEYDAARKAANSANNKIRQQNNLQGQAVDIHEIKPVKFGGSATDPANKIILERNTHRQEVTPWWNQLQKDVGG